MEFVDLVSDEEEEVQVVDVCPVCLEMVPERKQRFYFGCLHMFCRDCSRELVRSHVVRCPLCTEAMAEQIVEREVRGVPPPAAVPVVVYIEDNPALDDLDSYFSSDDSSVEWSETDE